MLLWRRRKRETLWWSEESPSLMRFSSSLNVSTVNHFHDHHLTDSSGRPLTPALCRLLRRLRSNIPSLSEVNPYQHDDIYEDSDGDDDNYDDNDDDNNDDL